MGSRLPDRAAVATGLTAFALACGVYANSLHGAFVIDDGSAIRTNQDLRPETPLVALLRNDYWGRPLASATSVKSYRPLTVLSFRANFALHGLAVEGYHLANIVLHASCSALVGAAVERLLVPGDAVAASVAAFTFAVHPVHTEAVASIVGRAELLCCLFYLLCLLAHAAACRPAVGCGRCAAYLLGSAVLALLATASKETGITAPAVAAALDVMRALPPSTAPRARLACAARCALCGAWIAAVFAASRWLRGAQLSPHFSHVDNPLPALPDGPSRLLSALHIHVRYARLLLWPAALSADYSFDCVPATRHVADARNLGVAALYLGLVGVGMGALRATRRDASTTRDAATTRDAMSMSAARQSPMSGAMTSISTPDTSLAAGRALVVLLVPMMPASHLLLPIGTLVAERLLYVPSVGYCALIGTVVSTGFRCTRHRSGPAGPAAKPAHDGRRERAPRAWVLPLSLLLQLLLGATLGGGLALGAAHTWARNRDWLSSDAITTATATVCPGSAKAQVSLGTMHLQKGNHSLAHAAFRAALRIHPEYSDALYWLGRLSLMRGQQLGEAERLVSGRCPAKRRTDTSHRAHRTAALRTSHRRAAHRHIAHRRTATLCAAAPPHRYISLHTTAWRGPSALQRHQHQPLATPSPLLASAHAALPSVHTCNSARTVGRSDASLCCCWA